MARTRQNHLDVNDLFLPSYRWLLTKDGQRKIDVDFMKAVGQDRADDVKIYLEAGANIEVTNLYSNKSLYLAAKAGHINTVNVLLDAGADRNAICNYDTPLHVAAKNGHKEVVKALIAAGANVRMKSTNTYEYEPLHDAVEAGQIDIVIMLLNAGADINAKTSHGRTPLSYAANANGECLQLIQILLEAGGIMDARFSVKPERKSEIDIIEKSMLVERLRHDPTSRFFGVPRDITRFELTPMLLRRSP